MARKWEHTRGTAALTVESHSAGSRWSVVTLVVHDGLVYMGPGKGYKNGMYWGQASYRRKVKYFAYHLKDKASAVELAERKSAELGIPFLPHIKNGDRVMTLVEGLIEGLSTLG